MELGIQESKHPWKEGPHNKAFTLDFHSPKCPIPSSLFRNTGEYSSNELNISGLARGYREIQKNKATFTLHAVAHVRPVYEEQRSGMYTRQSNKKVRISNRIKQVSHRTRGRCLPVALCLREKFGVRESGRSLCTNREFNDLMLPRPREQSDNARGNPFVDVEWRFLRQR
ncbi:hypothetical protein B296_00002598 [Ensete ventricosum]|uniref:Uncharacterized protein n=1 Tax=Ensete ventricosum TaxID=4639 RepID=A0A426YS77_ENSVE|nr:hypothetical protein B296_00002598 [Ensete ventricosum]